MHHDPKISAARLIAEPRDVSHLVEKRGCRPPSRHGAGAFAGWGSKLG